MQSVFYFDYGCVSFWNLTPKQAGFFYGLCLAPIMVASHLMRQQECFSGFTCVHLIIITHGQSAARHFCHPIPMQHLIARCAPCRSKTS